MLIYSSFSLLLILSPTTVVSFSARGDSSSRSHSRSRGRSSSRSSSRSSKSSHSCSRSRSRSHSRSRSYSRSRSIQHIHTYKHINTALILVWSNKNRREGNYIQFVSVLEFSKKGEIFFYFIYWDCY